ncbi:hypothetical protein T4B_12613 [Trichinella pseudospiralis]|uniref:Uncharacterized protein n=2 Tax=Trichinella pseudospiralis TaxID=6337 RepID=A0A0V1E3K4_TRIPS|nr:hypothetical protein T4A_8332 [Trichinella pseudospiralis]KRY86197.1 hypothetical protein T4D_10944 [Trichinella pseudospiralis]KRZ25865.1 hypothetical protein T4B_12613 [Trichinella pseudospiralis]KRZ37824.1 hypothetical protein T4C_15 [Trichinella pseudospiralis]
MKIQLSSLHRDPDYSQSICLLREQQFRRTDDVKPNLYPFSENKTQLCIAVIFLGRIFQLGAKKMEHEFQAPFSAFTFRFYQQNLGDVSKEHSERVHQDIKQTEQRHERQWNVTMIAGYRS